MPELDLKFIRPSKLTASVESPNDGIDELAATIKQSGLVGPIVVRPISSGHEYEIVVGERLCRAAVQAGLTTVSVVVRSYSDEEAIELRLVENIRRKNWSAVDKAKLCAEMRSRWPDRYQSWDSLADRIGVDPEVVHVWVRTLGLSEGL